MLKKAALTVEAILAILGLLLALCALYVVCVNVQNSPDGTMAEFLISRILPVAVYGLMIDYVFVAYKVPHGNHLRYLMFAFAAAMAVYGALTTFTVCSYVLPIAAVVVAFVAGRLHKIKKNTVAIIVASVLIVFNAVTCLTLPSPSDSIFFRLSSCLTFLIQWIVIILAYYARYREHKEAGFTA